VDPARALLDPQLSTHVIEYSGFALY